MKTKLPALSRSYLSALRKHLKGGRSSSAESARKLGLRAVKLGLDTLDLARIHQEALLALLEPGDSARTSDGMVRRAGAFFAEAITPIEETHRGAREANVQLKGMIATLTRRTVELAASNKELQHEIIRRKAMEESLRTSETTSSQLLEKSRNMQEELRHFSRRLLSAQEEERKKISRELHDVIAQTLTGINLRLATLRTQTTANARDLHKKIATTQKLVAKSVEIVHRFARDLRPTVLDDLGLIPALQAYMNGFMERTGIRVSFTAFAGVEKMDSARRTVLYRVAQESLTNVARHAKASQAKVTIQDHHGTVQMKIQDNGQGFEVEGAGFAKSRNRLGLLGMRERVEMIGGTFCVESAPGQPTSIIVDIPEDTHIAMKTPTKKSGNATLKCP
ncbi:MAG: sensor histidine kinase [Terrimicrobiaceae bacterium]